MWSYRSLTLAYSFALGLIAIMSIASHWTLQSVLREHDGAASVVNVSGRQRMLSQRIASLTAQYALGDRDAKGDMIAAINEFEAAHNILVRGDKVHGLQPASSSALRYIYFDKTDPLDGEVKTFITRARTIAAMDNRDARFEQEIALLFMMARNSLLSDLDAVVKVHQNISERQIEFLSTIQIGSLIVILITLLWEALGIFRPMVRRITQATKDLLRLATTDPLTGCHNRRSFGERGLAELLRARRDNREISILMIDIDKFKAVNDTHGHNGGDIALKNLAKYMALVVRPTDIVGRLGGEEFAIILPDADQAKAAIVAERIRAYVAAQHSTLPTGKLALTISIGVAAFRHGAVDLEEDMKRADEALYHAKAGGRNCVIVSDTSFKAAPDDRSRKVSDVDRLATEIESCATAKSYV